METTSLLIACVGCCPSSWALAAVWTAPDARIGSRRLRNCDRLRLRPICSPICITARELSSPRPRPASLSTTASTLLARRLRSFLCPRALGAASREVPNKRPALNGRGLLAPVWVCDLRGRCPTCFKEDAESRALSILPDGFAMFCHFWIVVMPSAKNMGRHMTGPAAGC